MKSINKLVKRDMKHLNNWLSKIKFDWMLKKQNIFKSPREVLSDEIKIKLSRKRLSNLVKYLGVKIDKVLKLHDQGNNIAVKLRAYPMLLINSQILSILRAYPMFLINSQSLSNVTYQFSAYPMLLIKLRAYSMLLTMLLELIQCYLKLELY